MISVYSLTLRQDQGEKEVAAEKGVFSPYRTKLTTVVRHPSEWGLGGYAEIQNPKQRYSVINHGEMANLLGIKDDVRMREVHRQWVEALLKNGANKRDAQWTESIAVGDPEKCGLCSENSYLWDVLPQISMI